MKAVLVDDEKSGIDTLAYLLKKHCPEIEVVGKFQNGRDAIEGIDSLKPEVVFLDIEMPLINGFAVLDMVNHKDFKTIFITAYNQYAIKAFRYNALDYLLKPVDHEELVDAVERMASSAAQPMPETGQMQSILDGGTPKNIVLKTYDGLHVVKLDDILYVEGQGAYSHFHISGRKAIMVSNNLKEYEQILPETSFFRAHQSFVINLKQIVGLRREKGVWLAQLQSDHSVPVSARRKEGLVAALEGMK